MKRISIGIVLSLLCFILLIVGATFGVLATQSGSRWLLNQVPGLTVDNFQGAVLTDWSAEQLHWQQDDLSVQLSALQVQLRPSCLLRRAVCLDVFEAGRIELTLPQTDSPDEPQPEIQLPDLKLPLSIEVTRLQVDEFVLNGQSLLSDAGVGLSWLDDGIYLREIGLKHQEYAVQAHGKITPHAGWPLELQLSASLPMPDAPTLEVNAELSGSVQALALKVNTTGYLTAALDGQLQALEANLPAQLSIRIAEFIATPDVPDTLKLADLVIQLQGDLHAGYEVNALAHLPNTPEQMQLSVAALLKTSGAHLSALRLSASKKAFVALQGTVDWQSELQADAHVQWQNFPWHSLLAQEDIPVQLQTLNGQVSYSAGDYQGTLQGDLLGPAGPFSVATAFDGNLQQIKLSKLWVKAGQGHVQGSATVGFADGVDWLADIQVSKLNPA